MAASPGAEWETAAANWAGLPPTSLRGSKFFPTCFFLTALKWAVDSVLPLENFPRDGLKGITTQFTPISGHLKVTGEAVNNYASTAVINQA